jgi:hypothetical protein
MAKLQSNALTDLLADKMPVAMYDALHAARLLSSKGLRSSAVMQLMQDTMRLSRRRGLESVAVALAESGYLNEAGLALFERVHESQSPGKSTPS